MTNSLDESTTVAAILAKSPSLGLTIPEDTSFQHWLAVGKHLALADNALAWRVGDWWIYGEHRYGDRIARMERFRASAHVGIMQQWPVPLKRHGAVTFFPSAITERWRPLKGNPAFRQARGNKAASSRSLMSAAG